VTQTESEAFCFVPASGGYFPYPPISHILGSSSNSELF